MVVRHRSRHVAITAPDLRSLRQGLGLTLSEAAAVLGEPPSLLQQQEQGGSGTDKEFIDECLAKLCEQIIVAAHGHALPPVIDSQGTPSIYWLRFGLGLSTKDAAAILGRAVEEIDSLEDGQSSVPHAVRDEAWLCYAAWVERTRRRFARVWREPEPIPSRVRERRLHHRVIRSPALDRLAYTPQLSTVEAEARARKALDLPPT